MQVCSVINMKNYAIMSLLMKWINEEELSSKAGINTTMENGDIIK